MKTAAAKGRRLILLAAVCLLSALLVVPAAEASRSLPAALAPAFSAPATPDLVLEESTADPQPRHRLFGDLSRLERPLDAVPIQKTASGVFSLGIQPNIRQKGSLEQNRSGPTFQGLWTDPVTGISYARNRWYDARTASWLSEDPKGAVDSPNLYAFVGWGPHVGRDPMGLAEWTEESLAQYAQLRADYERYKAASEGEAVPITDIQAWNPGSMRSLNPDAFENRVPSFVYSEYNLDWYTFAEGGDPKTLAALKSRVNSFVYGWENADFSDGDRLYFQTEWGHFGLFERRKMKRLHAFSRLGNDVLTFSTALGATGSARSNMRQIQRGPHGPGRSVSTGPLKAGFDLRGTWARPSGWRLPAAGKWEGTIGDSKFTPKKPARYGLQSGEGVVFKEGFPDFSPLAVETFKVEGLTGVHRTDMPMIHRHIARQRGWLKSDNTPNANAARVWLSEQGLTPHHAGGSNVQLIPTPLNQLTHVGGAYELRNQ